MPRHWQVILLAALGIGATVLAVPRALSRIVAVPGGESDPGISRTAAVETTSTRPATEKMPAWSPTPSGSSTPDTRPPTPVGNLRLVSNTDATLAIAWDASSDDVGVKAYQVKGDGFSTISTSSTQATLPWAHRTSAVTVQVSALDTSNNRSDWRTLSIPAPAVQAVVVVSNSPTSDPSPTTDPSTTDPTTLGSPPDPSSSQTGAGGASTAGTSTSPTTQMVSSPAASGNQPASTPTSTTVGQSSASSQPS